MPFYHLKQNISVTVDKSRTAKVEAITKITKSKILPLKLTTK
jgi:hypothetical protein